MGEMRFLNERQQSFIDRMNTCLDGMIRAEKGKGRPKRILILGHCIAAVEDDYGKGECDVYFTSSMWGPQHDVWGDDLYPPKLEAMGLGCVSGLGSTDRLTVVEDADRWVRNILKPLNSGFELLEPGKYHVYEIQEGMTPDELDLEHQLERVEHAMSDGAQHQ